MLYITSTYNRKFDLAKKHLEYEANDIECFFYMANAYVLRMATFVEMLAGQIEDHIVENCIDQNFKFSQQHTFHNREFQELAAAAAYEFIRSIDERINISGLQKYIVGAINYRDEISFTYREDFHIDREAILVFLDNIDNFPKVTPEVVNYFIKSNRKPNNSQ